MALEGSFRIRSEACSPIRVIRGPLRRTYAALWLKWTKNRSLRTMLKSACSVFSIRFSCASFELIVCVRGGLAGDTEAVPFNETFRGFCPRRPFNGTFRRLLPKTPV